MIKRECLICEKDFESVLPVKLNRVCPKCITGKKTRNADDVNQEIKLPKKIKEEIFK